MCGFLQAKFCSTVANDIMLDTGVGVVRMWADEASRLSRFRMLFTSFADREFLLQLLLASVILIFFLPMSHLFSCYCCEMESTVCGLDCKQICNSFLLCCPVSIVGFKSNDALN